MELLQELVLTENWDKMATVPILGQYVVPDALLRMLRRALSMQAELAQGFAKAALCNTNRKGLGWDPYDLSVA